MPVGEGARSSAKEKPGLDRHPAGQEPSEAFSGTSNNTYASPLYAEVGLELNGSQSRAGPTWATGARRLRRGLIFRRHTRFRSGIRF